MGFRTSLVLVVPSPPFGLSRRSVGNKEKHPPLQYISRLREGCSQVAVPPHTPPPSPQLLFAAFNLVLTACIFSESSVMTANIEDVSNRFFDYVIVGKNHRIAASAIILTRSSFAGGGVRVSVVNLVHRHVLTPSFAVDGWVDFGSSFIRRP